MLATLDTPYADARADELSFALGLPPLDALAVLPVERDGLTVQLRLLGASHQVIAGPLSETVACLPGAADPLPGRASTTLPGWAYDFSATTDAHDDDAAFGRAVDAVCARLADRGDALTGAFPGSRHAVTALALENTGIGWRTWHAYPQTREIVMTRSRLVSPS
ncbi:DUF2617 family protein [Actinomadura rubrisoli]|uniref:DUF2617 family protein n=1 Tax=Actinomadura rubrisoli TaxID=2530368 RepID=A0A4R5C753_9ACTN|nr:DUF2617 family protein [Actinomadura rubrisoli]TDD95621.1 DUF2617 family protein [Actinomadura rubrisoli]